MSVVKHATAGYGTLESSSYFLDILSQGNSGAWVLKLPPRLQTYQTELESLLGKVFSGRPNSRENLELAQQMTINWCVSKCRKIGMSIEDSYQESV
jgi:hypothetical protein